MNAKSTIRKIVFVTVWCCIGGGMLTLLLAAISKRNKGKCSDYAISLKGEGRNRFMDKADVERLLIKTTGGRIKGELVSKFPLQQLEIVLEENTWVDNAELYFDNKDVLHISVTQKEPVARVFTVKGNSFYIDKLNRRMPLSDKMSARVPVFTGFPDKKILTAKDSVLLEQIRVAAEYIINDPFWMAQVAQIDIDAERNFEMVPLIGNHVVRLGDGEQIDKKLRRLFLFYRQVISRAGFNTYKWIDVRYKGQVVASKKFEKGTVDSVQLRKNVERLLKQAREGNYDTTVRVSPLPGKPIILERDPDIVRENMAVQTEDPNALKTTSVAQAEPKSAGRTKPAQAEPKESKKTPKAVMPPRQQTGGQDSNE